MIKYLDFTINYPNKIRGEVGAVKLLSVRKCDFIRKLAQSRLFSLRRRYEGRIPVIPLKGAQALRPHLLRPPILYGKFIVQLRYFITFYELMSSEQEM